MLPEAKQSQKAQIGLKIKLSWAPMLGLLLGELARDQEVLGSILANSKRFPRSPAILEFC